MCREYSTLPGLVPLSLGAPCGAASIIRPPQPLQDDDRLDGAYYTEHACAECVRPAAWCTCARNTRQ